jgi:hypothetical protein
MEREFKTSSGTLSETLSIPAINGLNTNLRIRTPDSTPYSRLNSLIQLQNSPPTPEDCPITRLRRISETSFYTKIFPINRAEALSPPRPQELYVLMLLLLHPV